MLGYGHKINPQLIYEYETNKTKSLSLSLYIYIYVCVKNGKLNKQKYRQLIQINISSLFHQRLLQNVDEIKMN